MSQSKVADKKPVVNSKKTITTSLAQTAYFNPKFWRERNKLAVKVGKMMMEGIL